MLWLKCIIKHCCLIVPQFSQDNKALDVHITELYDTEKKIITINKPFFIQKRKIAFLFKKYKIKDLVKFGRWTNTHQCRNEKLRIYKTHCGDT